MPHLAEIQKKYKDQVTVLAISDEDLATVEAFMAKDSIIEGKTWAQAMSFVVATDPDKSVKTEIFSAAGRRGIPSSFIIGKDGKIEWIGHPIRIDEPLAAVLDGTWDREAARKKYDEDQVLQEGTVIGFHPHVVDHDTAGTITSSPFSSGAARRPAGPAKAPPSSARAVSEETGLRR